MKFTKILSAFVLPVMLFSCNSASTKKTSKEETKKQPNIVVVLCDDLGYADVGFNGGKDALTPALDGLASQGTVFSDAYVVHPFCGPSRAGIMTGRYPHAYGSQFNLPREHNQHFEDTGIPLNEVFISKVLKDAGYYTGIVGKWHLGEVEKYLPNDRGFDDFYGFAGGGHNYFPEQYKAAYARQKKNGVEHVWGYLCPLEHNGEEVDEKEYLTDGLSREACRFVTEASEKENPFFLYLAYNAPHSPMEAKEEDLAKCMHVKDEARRTYVAMVHAVDRGVEKLITTLKETGEYENTLIVFFSDNGGKLQLAANNYPLTGGKGDTNEGGYRTPMFFHWPGKVPAGQTFEYPVSALDLYPTFARLANAKIPEGKVLDGKDIWDDFLAGKNPRKGEMIYAMRHRTGYTDVGARRDDWKVLKTDNGKWKLINIKEDIAEQNDLSAQYPEILKELVAEAEKWSKTHVQPKWFHDVATGEDWKEAQMPKFDNTFEVN